MVKSVLFDIIVATARFKRVRTLALDSKRSNILRASERVSFQNNGLAYIIRERLNWVNYMARTNIRYTQGGGKNEWEMQKGRL